MRRALGLAAAVIAAMALGQVITDHVSLDGVTVRPFVRTGGLGDQVRLRYADVRVDRVRSAAQLESPSGRMVSPTTFLILDVTVVARHEPTTLSGVTLQDPEGRTYAVTTRAGCTGPGMQYPTGVPYHAMYCLELPLRAIAGSHLVLSMGQEGTRGGIARDDLARIDLGIDRAQARRLYASKLAYEGYVGGPDLPHLATLPPAAPGSNEPEGSS